MKLLLFCVLLGGIGHRSQAQDTFFEQHFSIGSSLSTYIGNDPKSQFTLIEGNSNTCVAGNSTAAITNSTLEFYRPRGCSGQVIATRSIDFLTIPRSLYIQFSLEVETSADGIGAAFIGFGANGANSAYVDNGTYRNDETFAKLTIGFKASTAANAFTLRDVNTNITSAAFTGRKTITWVLNNSGFVVTYLTPDGSTQRLANNLYDAWIGNTRVLTNRPAITADIDIKRFKIVFEGGQSSVGKIWIGDLLFRDVSGILPVSITDFRALVNGPRVDLSWQTENVADGSFFDVERSRNGLEYAVIQHISYELDRTHYGYTDHAPLPGTSYYRLRQHSPDGITTLSRPVAVNVVTTAPGLTVLDNPGNGLVIQLYSNNLIGATYQLASLTGQRLPCQTSETPDGQVTLQPQHPLPSGVYLLTATTGTVRLTRRVLIQ
ncbi:T9SS type A sorting domain-containing protein [Fibrella sp. HMF5335]|uniref:T9SS type A sorting domain-containing protein n=1 Tax=Fibrella rubiginis TaxID=2817060 RepID=A0A939GEM0_9BACT|nr:T9SS type A sorting domain-containing protein [Fibrella rubiginis]MBO0935400.1 T9SS type A sorting domain-containing protein [Fibrella rubiginis]